MAGRCRKPTETVLVVMPACTMGMAVGQFFFASFAYIQNFDSEGQILASQRVVGIHLGLGQPDFDDGNLARSLIRLNNGNHTWLPLLGALQAFDLHFLDRIIQPRAVGLICGQGNTEIVSSLTSFKGFHQTIDQTGLAMQVQDRIVIVGAFDLAGGIREGVMELNYAVIADLHRGDFRSGLTGD